VLSLASDDKSSLAVDEDEVQMTLQPKCSPNTFLTAGQSFLKSKYLDCAARHRLCAIWLDSSFTPTRLLDTDEKLHHSVRLVELSRITHQRGYATLSHCWGRSRAVKLTSANRESFLRGIPIDSLPLTFQHAIGVVRSLGVRYLWIDSLCIVQDSVADWEVESSVMASVYGHASVNIAATSSSDSGGGLFFDRDPDTVQPFAVYSPGEEGKLNCGWYLWKNDGRWSGLAAQPLNRRAWVLQERLLSTRTAHFTRSEIIWHCLEDLSSETLPKRCDDGRLTVPVMQIGDYTDIRIAMAKLRTSTCTNADPCMLAAARLKNEALDQWLSTLLHYSRCGLTVQSDKLVAIDGMARQLEALTGDSCLAGLWRSQLPACLLWSVYRGTAPDLVIRKPTAGELESWRTTAVESAFVELGVAQPPRQLLAWLA
jgi:hypothetical protein